jgi:hypothetical protein
MPGTNLLICRPCNNGDVSRIKDGPDAGHLTCKNCKNIGGTGYVAHCVSWDPNLNHLDTRNEHGTLLGTKVNRDGSFSLVTADSDSRSPCYIKWNDQIFATTQMIVNPTDLIENDCDKKKPSAIEQQFQNMIDSIKKNHPFFNGCQKDYLLEKTPTATRDRLKEFKDAIKKAVKKYFCCGCFMDHT